MALQWVIKLKRSSPVTIPGFEMSISCDGIVELSKVPRNQALILVYVNPIFRNLIVKSIDQVFFYFFHNPQLEMHLLEGPD